MGTLYMIQGIQLQKQKGKHHLDVILAPNVHHSCLCMRVSFCLPFFGVQFDSFMN